MHAARTMYYDLQKKLDKTFLSLHACVKKLPSKQIQPTVEDDIYILNSRWRWIFLWVVLAFHSILHQHHVFFNNTKIHCIILNMEENGSKYHKAITWIMPWFSNAQSSNWARALHRWNEQLKSPKIGAQSVKNCHCHIVVLHFLFEAEQYSQFCESQH